MTTAMRRKEDLEEQKEAMLPTLRSKLLAPTDVEEANDRLRRFLLWQALNGVAVMTYYVVRSLYVTRIAGDNPVSGSNLALREAVVATIASVVGANFVPPCADNPRVGRKPLLLLNSAVAAVQMLIMAVWPDSIDGFLGATALAGCFTSTMSVVIPVDCVAGGATARESFWRPVFGGVFAPGAPASPAPTGSRQFVVYLVDVVVAEIAAFALGGALGVGVGTAIAIVWSIPACLVIASATYLASLLIGAATLRETLPPDTPAPPARAFASPTALLEVLRGDPGDVELGAYVGAYVCACLAVGAIATQAPYYLLWKFDMSDTVYLEFQLTPLVAFGAGLAGYVWWARDALGGPFCLHVAALALCLALLIMGLCNYVEGALAALVIAGVPFAAVVQFLAIQACVAPEHQGKLAAALQLVGGFAVALGLAAGQLLWIQLKTSAAHGSPETRADFRAGGAFYLSAIAALAMATAIWPVAKLDRSRLMPQDSFD